MSAQVSPNYYKIRRQTGARVELIKQEHFTTFFVLKYTSASARTVTLITGLLTVFHRLKEMISDDNNKWTVYADNCYHGLLQ